MFGRLVFSEWVGKVFVAWGEIHQELILTEAVLYQMVTLIHGYVSLGLDSFIGVTFSRCVVDLQGSWGLGMTQFFQGRHN